MTPDEYRAFTKELVDCVRRSDEIVGVVALGSMAAVDYQPDAWSDHDFWLITVPGAQEAWRRQRDWLPAPERIIFHMRETEHGVKVVYDTGHLLEYAVFDAEELAVARVNRYRILLDRIDLAGRMAALRRQTEEAALDERPDDRWLMGQFLIALLVGHGRYQRGEVLSGHQFVRHIGLEHLIRLLSRHVEAPEKQLLDDLSPLRRFGAVYPRLGAELAAVLDRPVPATALGLLTIAERELPSRLVHWPADLAAVLRRRLTPRQRPHA